MSDLEKKGVNCVNTYIHTAHLNPNQVGALVSWAFDIGEADCINVKGSALRKRINNGENPNTVAK